MRIILQVSMKELEYHIMKLLPTSSRKKDEDKKVLEKRKDDQKAKLGHSFKFYAKPIFKAKKFDLF